MILEDLSSTVGIENRKKSNHCVLRHVLRHLCIEDSSYMSMFVCYKGDPGLPGPPGVPGPTVSYSVVIFLLSLTLMTLKHIKLYI